MKRRQVVRDYFTFSRNERIALLLFAGAVVLVYLLPSLLPAPKPAPVQADAGLQNMLDSARAAPAHAAQRTSESPAYELSSNASVQGVLFYFDPNTLDADGWMKLGLRAKTAHTIINYRTKGGHFYKPADLKKIWGLSPEFYTRVAPYMRLATAEPRAPKTNFFKSPYPRHDAPAIVDVNAADSTALIRLPGIGEKLAARIINFRNRLGGFYSVAQLGETYGLPDSVFQSLKPYLQVHGSVKKIPVNTATKDELKMHPYIRWSLASALVEYRTQHGSFKTAGDLKNVMLLDDATRVRIEPYLSFD